MNNFCVGDIVKTKNNSILIDFPNISKDNLFIIFFISNENKVCVLPFGNIYNPFPFKRKSIYELYDLNNFYKANQIRLILEKKENNFLSKIISR